MVIVKSSIWGNTLASSSEARAYLRRDTFYSETNSGLLLSSPGPSLELSGRGAYQLFERLVPFLDGTVSRGELQAAIGASRWPTVEGLLGPLTEKGFLRWISQTDIDKVDARDRTEYAEQIAFLAQYSDTPHADFARFRETSVHLIGLSALTETIARNLLANGHNNVHLITDPVSAASRALPAGLRIETELGLSPAHHIIVSPTAEALAWFQAQERAHPERFLVIVPDGDTLWALPHTWGIPNQANPNCSDAVTALQRAGRMTDLEDCLLAADQGLDPLTGRAATVQVQRMLGALLSYEAFKGLTGAVEAETSQGAIALNVVTGETTAHRVLPSEERSPATVSPADVVPAPAVLSPALSDSRASEYPGWRNLTGDVTMPATGFDDAELKQLPLKVAVVSTTAGGKRTGASLWTLADARIDAIAKVYEDIVARLEPDNVVATLRNESGREYQILTESFLRPSRAYAAGAPAGSNSAVGIGLTAEDAARRAIDKAAVKYRVDAYAQAPNGVQFSLSPGDSVTDFLLDILPSKASLTFIDLGQAAGISVVAAIWKENGGSVQWHAAAGGSRSAAAAAAAIELLSLKQLPQGTKTESMLAWPDIDVLALLQDQRTDGASGADVPSQSSEAYLGIIRSDALAGCGLEAVVAAIH